MIMQVAEYVDLSTERSAPLLDRVQYDHKEYAGMGFKSLLSLGLAPLGSVVAGFHRSLGTRSRFQHGLIIILPGIEGCSSVNDSIARGLVAGRLPHGMSIIDWRRFRPWNPLHLAMEQHNHTQAGVVAKVVVDYHREYPGQPVHLIGHSAGAGIALFTLEQLPADHAVTTVTLLAAAVSRKFNVLKWLPRTKCGIWNFYSPLDFPTVGLGTLLFGTMDRRHEVSPGALGFLLNSSDEVTDESSSVRGPELHQIPFHSEMVKSWNFGGHFGSTNAVFVQRYIVQTVVIHLVFAHTEQISQRCFAIPLLRDVKFTGRRKQSGDDENE